MEQHLSVWIPSSQYPNRNVFRPFWRWCMDGQPGLWWGMFSCSAGWHFRVSTEMAFIHVSAVKCVLGLKGCLLQAFPALLPQAGDMLSTNAMGRSGKPDTCVCKDTGAFLHVVALYLCFSFHLQEVSSWSAMCVVHFLPLSVPWEPGSHVDGRKRGVWSSALAVGAPLSMCVCDVRQISPAGLQMQLCHLRALETPYQSRFVLLLAVKGSKLGIRFRYFLKVKSY